MFTNLLWLKNIKQETKTRNKSKNVRISRLGETHGNKCFWDRASLNEC